MLFVPQETKTLLLMARLEARIATLCAFMQKRNEETASEKIRSVTFYLGYADVLLSICLVKGPECGRVRE